MTELSPGHGNHDEASALSPDARDETDSLEIDGDLSSAEEEAIRRRARARLRAQEEADRLRDQARREERAQRLEAERLRWQIVEDETERFHRQRGRVRYVSSRGQVLWLSPEDVSARRAHRVRGRRKGRSRSGGRTGTIVATTLRTAGVSLVIAFGLVVVLAAAIYAVELS